MAGRLIPALSHSIDACAEGIVRIGDARDSPNHGVAPETAYQGSRGGLLTGKEAVRVVLYTACPEGDREATINEGMS